MPINADKPYLWKADVEQSIDFYNDWFLRFAPETYRKQRAITAGRVTDSLKKTKFLAEVSPEVLQSYPEILPILRMSCAPPIARDRLMGLAYVGKNLIESMEGKGGSPARVPPRMPEDELQESLSRVSEIISELADRDLFPWLETGKPPAKKSIDRAATVVADRLCGAIADPIIRNAQESRKLGAMKDWLESKGYKHVSAKDFSELKDMPSGTFTFRMNVSVGKGSHKNNMPIDALIQPFHVENAIPIFVEAKSAGDATNTNKRRKEEAQKYSQLKKKFGSVPFVLFLCGYFEPGYLGYEASEGIDWVWEHRISDFDVLLESGPSKKKVCEPTVAYGGPKSRKETERYARQLQIDNSRTQHDRNVLGQFSTPFSLASQIVSLTQNHLNSEAISFLEPSVGAGAFFSALDRVSSRPVEKAVGVEIDEEYATVAQSLWSSPYQVIQDDFLVFSKDPSVQGVFNLLCANPPYVRHHHMSSDVKRQLQKRVENELGIRSSGLSGLYIYFVLLSHRLLAAGAVASWLIPSEFMSVNYGQALREYLTRHVTLLQVHQFCPEDVQFDDALVSSCVITYRKQKPATPYSFRFSIGGELDVPKRTQLILADDATRVGKWNYENLLDPKNESSIKIKDLFEIKRGVATGANGFFILDTETIEKYAIPEQFLRPLMPGPRYLKTDVVEADGRGIPVVDQVRYLLSCDLPPSDVKASWPRLWEYMQVGVERGIPDCYICSHRKIWYLQEKRAAPLFFVTYMGRVRDGSRRNPFRFILNRSQAIATNVYLYIYPRPFLKKLLEESPDRAEWLHQMLNQLSSETLIQNGRTYGGGLHKLEPKELAEMPLPELPDWLRIDKEKQTALPLTFG